MINGYKMLKETPLVRKGADDFDSSIRSSFLSNGDSSSKFRLPMTPSREELGHKIANEAQIRKREQKAKDKFNHFSKLGLAMCAQESVGNKTVSDAALRTPLSIHSGKSGLSSCVAGSVKSMMTPGSIHSYKSGGAASNYSGRRPSRKEFSTAGQQLLSKLMKKK